MKDVVIIANFVGEIDGNANSRFTYLADLLKKNNQTELISSDFSHKNKRQRNINIHVQKFPYKVTLIHEPGYLKNISIRRFLSHKIWGDNVYKYLLGRKKPDVIYCAVPSLTAASKAALYCKKNNIKFIIDIQDLWPEAFQMVFHVPIISKLFFMPFKFLANRIYENADAICAVSRTYAERALKESRKCEKAHVVFLGTELKYFDECAKKYREKSHDDFWIGYCGTLGNSYDLKCVIDALAILDVEHGLRPCFIVMGDGPRRIEFENYAKEKGIKAIFTGRLPYEKMCGKLKSCDIVVNPIMPNAAQSIINKHADYAASALPVINTQECVEYRDLVDRYQMGFNCNNNDPVDMAIKMVELMNNITVRMDMGNNARKCAEEMFDRGKSYKELINLIEGCI